MIRLLTGNELLTGDVLWWTGSAWSFAIADAADVGAEGEALVARFAKDERISDLAVIDAEPGSPPRPKTMRERIRAFGPTVRSDLARPGAPDPTKRAA